MKRFFIALSIIVLAFGCERSDFPDGWLPMPEERIKSYFPIKETDTVTYISENNETLSYRCYVYAYNYHPYWQKGKGQQRGIHYDNLSCGVSLQCISNPNKYLDYSLDILLNRIRLCVYYGFKDNINGDEVRNGGGLDKGFETDHKKDKGMGYPKYPNEFIEYLTDTIELRNRDTEELTGILVSGKGLAWFTDHEGVKWYLQE